MPLVPASFDLAPYLIVPKEDREAVKKLGAKFNANAKRWFVPKELPAASFAKWLPKIDSAFNLRAKTPFFLLESSESCYSCGELAYVVTLASQGLEGADINQDLFYVYHYIECVPDRLGALLRRNYKTYFIDHSKTTNSCYWMNHCKCGAPLGDHFMHMEPDGAFFPMDEESIKEMKLIEIKSTGNVALRAEAATSASDAILLGAKRSKYES